MAQLEQQRTNDLVVELVRILQYLNSKFHIPGDKILGLGRKYIR